jgi:C4-dicarboxylate-specific signal transduction histidine kinase
MGNQGQGALVGVLLLAATGLSGLPEDMVGFGVVLSSALLIDRFKVSLSRNILFTPALPVVLGGALDPQVGAAAGLLFVLIQALSDLEEPFLSTVAHSLALATTLVMIGAAQEFALDPPWVSFLLAPVVYLLVRWYTVNLDPPRNSEEKQLWYHLHLRIRPLELGYAAAAPLIALCCQFSPFTLILLVPLLATGRLAAENVLLRAHDQSLDQLLGALKSTADRGKQAEESLKKERQQKKILEGFTSMLAGRPEVAEICEALLDTTQALMQYDSGAVFLGSPPAPFFYRADRVQESRLQGSALTGLREPVVDRARKEGRPVHQRQPPGESPRLFLDDTVAAAVPMGQSGVLYLGRAQSRPFAKDELDQLTWLAKKAELALDVSFRQQESTRRQRSLHQTVQTLEHRLAWMSLLMKSTEKLVSTLSSEELTGRLESVLQEALPHHSGYLELGSDTWLWADRHVPGDGLLKRARETVRPLHFEELSNTPYGSATPYESLLATPIQTGETVLGRVVLFHRDRKAYSSQQADLLFLLGAQAAMALSNSHLYEEVVDARKKLQDSQAKLIQSSKMTSIGQLAAGVAHELNSPIGAISLSLEEAILSLENNPALAKTVLTLALGAVERSKGIIDRMMGYTRSPLGTVEELDWVALIKETIEFVGPQLRNAEVTVRFDFEGEAIIKGERGPLQQILVNLLLNGIDAVADLPPEKRVLTLNMARSDDGFQLQVQDCGCGISETDLSRVFDPFFTTKDVGSGTGLGLWVCHQIVAEHGGEISVTSVLGSGTTFTVDLPRVTA